jgi:hypothetical protein
VSWSLPLFDTPRVNTPCIKSTPIDTDIRRIIEHKAGPLREILEDGRVGREFRLAEITDGRFVRIFDDGSREPSPVAVTPFLIADAIRFGTFVEVACAGY